MWGLSNFLPATFTEKALSPELRSRLELRLMPEEGSRSEFKDALFAAYALGAEVRQAEMDLMAREFADYAKQMFTIKAAEPLPLLFPMDLLYERESAASSYRKIYRPNGETAVLWDRMKGKQFNDDS